MSSFIKNIILPIIATSSAYSAQGGWQNQENAGGECITEAIFGIFPTMGLSCETLATLLGITSIACAYVFWTQVTK